jgi:predicted GIY-YIG superfamily endonuclease
MKCKIYIYCVYFPTSEKFYIGQTDNLDRRFRHHFNSDSLVGKALNKYDDWKISILHTTSDRNVANQIEIEEIRNFNSIAPNGYNLTHGGDGWSPTKEIREKISVSKRGIKFSQEHKYKLSEVKKGHSVSLETRKKLSRAAIGKKRSRESILRSWITRYKKIIDQLEKEL